MKKNKKVQKQKKIIRNIGIIFSLVFILSSIIFDIFVYGVNILPIKYFLPLVIISNLFVALFSIILIKPKFRIWFKILIMLISMMICIVFWIGCSYINKTYHFMDKIRSRNIITEKYYVVVNKDSGIKKLSELDDLEIGTFNENIEIYDKAIEKFNSLSKGKLVESNSIDELVNNLLDNSVSAILISSAHEEFVKDNFSDFDSKTEIIYTIEIEVKTKTAETKNVDVKKDTFTIYISGIDSYGDISIRSRSDVNMLVTINPNNYEILLTSIPRDYYVKLHDKEGYKDKLTHAGFYGVDESVLTIEDLLDIDIDYYIKVNFSTLTNVVDILGGIDVYSDKSFVPYNYKHLYIQKGVNHMDGEMALAFARERYAYLEGDRHRVQNQQDIITAIIKKVTSSTEILTKYTTLLDELSNSFETNIATSDITSLIKMQLDKMPSWTIKKYSLNGSDAYDYTYSFGSQELYVMVPYEETITQAKKYIDGMESGLSFKELGLE